MSTVVDIGCGDGSGVKALLEGSSEVDIRVIAIDENLSCIAEAENRLRAAGFTVEVVVSNPVWTLEWTVRLLT